MACCRKLFCFPSSDVPLNEPPGENPSKRWREKWSAITTILKKRKEVDTSEIVFNTLIGIFALEDVVENLYFVYDIDSSSVHFFLPEICNFLLYGDEDQSTKLEGFVLSKCQHSVQFAHRVFWYILSSLSSDESTLSRGHSLIKSVVEAGGISSLHHRLILYSSPNRRRSISKSITGSLDDSRSTSAGTSSVNSKGSSAAGSTRAGGEDDDGPINNILSAVEDATDLFLATPKFLDELARISTDLVTVRPERRQAELRHRLHILNDSKLPCDVYLPLAPLESQTSTRQHSVLRIPLSDAFCLNSKDRVPFHICVEVMVHNNNIPYTTLQNGKKLVLHAGTEFDFKTLSRFTVACITSAAQKNLSNGRRQSHDSVSEPENELVDETGSRDSTPYSSRNGQLSGYPLSMDATVPEEEIHDAEDQATESSLLISPSNGRPRGLFGTSSWNQVKERVRSASPFGSLPNWDLLSVIVKSGEDLKQEQFASQLIVMFQDIFSSAKLPLWLRPFHIIATSGSSGLIETVPNAVSLDRLKKTTSGYTSLLDYFHQTYGGPDSAAFRQARKNFVSSMAAYSIICYLLQIKDRHNGNILIDTDGHVIHVDFGFILSTSPGSVNFEAAPFKLTKEFVDVMGGPRSSSFKTFRSLCVQGFLQARKHCDRICSLVEMMMMSGDDLPCFEAGEAVLNALRRRFRPDLSNWQSRQFVLELIAQSTDNWRTKWYDKYQRFCVGIW
eukprot:GILJ01005239.1.p1 GENE.GILJ01005239.1~~GILJ01005239.1.p1  ORF type:complete len:774 (+),score=109.60 GILJ01005239.1:138-2324(+)